MDYTYGESKITILPTPAGGCDGTLTVCTLPKASFDEKTEVTINAVVPPAADLKVDPDAGKPAQVVFKQCFAQVATVGRKWRKMNDPFKVRLPCTAFQRLLQACSSMFALLPALAQQLYKTKRLLPLDLHCLLYTSPSPRDATLSRMPSSA